MSAPATNAFSPLPVTIIAFTSLFTFASLNASCTSLIVAMLSECNYDGLLIVMVATPFWF